MNKAILLLIPLTALFVSCDSKELAAADKEEPSKFDDKSKIATKPGNQKALAKVGESVLTIERFKEEFQLRGRGRTDIEGRQAVLDTLIERMKMLEYARQKGYDEDPDYRRQVEDLLIAKVQNEEKRAAMLSRKTDLSKNAAREYYEENIEKFTTPERARVSIIFVAANPSNKEDKRMFVEDLRGQVIAAALQPTENFGHFAGNFSDDAHSKVRGGDIGYLLKGRESSSRQPKELFEAAFQLKNEGDISEPIETDRGFYLLKITDRAEASVRPFEAVENSINARLAAGNRGGAESGVQEMVNEKISAEIDTKLLESITLEQSANFRPLIK